MEFILFLIVLVCLFFLKLKLNRMEEMLKELLFQPKMKDTPSEKILPVQSEEKIAEEKPQEVPAETPPAPLSPEPEQQQEIPESSSEPQTPQKPEKSTLWDSFCNWFWLGNTKGKENVSKEYAIATTWLMRAGVIVLICGIGFFLKYSIENNLISPPVRLCLTFLAGIAMFAGGLFMVNKRFHILAVGILSIGTVTLYMAPFAGYKLYHILPLEISFIFMVLTTIATMHVSVKFGLLPLALTGCTGAYLTPLMLSDGSGNIPFFLGYTAVISAGLLIISRERRWRSLEITAFLLSFILMGYAILGSCIFFSSRIKLNWWCLAFVFINYLVFTMIPLIRKKELPSGKTEILLPILSTAIALLFGLSITEDLAEGNSERIMQAGYAVLLSAVSFVEGLLLIRKQGTGTNAVPACFGASAFALALAIPLAWKDTGIITAGWSVLGLILIFAAERCRYKTLLFFSGLVFTAAFFSMTSYLELKNELFSDRLLSFGTFTLCLLGAGFILRKNKFELSENGKCTEHNNWFPQYKISFYITGGISFLLYSSFEVYRGLSTSENFYNFRHGGLSVWWGLLVAMLIIWGIRKDLKELRFCGLILFVICILKVYCLDISELNTLEKVIAFLALGILFLGSAAAYILYRKHFDHKESEDLQEKEKH